MSDALAGRVRAIYAEAQRDCQAPALGFLVSAGGDTLCAADSALPFRIASMTKSFTAAAILLLRDRGALRLDDALSRWVPETAGITAPATDSPVIVLRDLLTMSAGFATDNPWGDRLLDLTDSSFDEQLRRGITFATAPATTYLYSNLGYALLGRVVSNAAGMRYQDFVTSELLRPLGMTATSWTPPPHFAMPHRLSDDLAVADAPPLDDGAFAAMGGLWSTAEDVARWASFLMDAFPARDGTDDGPLRRASRREMQQVQRASAPASVTLAGEEHLVRGGYGFGLRILTESPAGPVAHHSGGLPGYGSNMMWQPETRTVAVALANITYAPMAAANLRVFAEIRSSLGEQPQPLAVPAHLRAAMDGLIALLNNWDDTTAREIFALNVELDEDFGSRARTIGVALGGEPHTVGTIRCIDRANAVATLLDAGGTPTHELEIMLTPEVPPRIQWYEIRTLG